MVSRDLEGEVKYLELLNARLSDEVDLLKKLVEHEHFVNKLLIEKLAGAPRGLNQFTTADDLEAIPGYEPLHSRIEAAERKSREDVQAANKAGEAEEETEE